jgi:hypothetical protein
MAIVDWVILKNEYITDETVSYRSLSEKYGVSDTAIAERASRERWAELRRDTLVKVGQKLVEKTTDKIATFLADKLTTGLCMVELGTKGIYENPPQNARESKDLIELGYKIATEALGLNVTKNIIENTQDKKLMSLDQFFLKMKEHTENESDG